MIKIEYLDCLTGLKQMPSDSVDLVLTSPPYSDIISYGNKVDVHDEEKYVAWFLPIVTEIARVLKPSGSFILNINDFIKKDRSRSLYVFELITEISKLGSIKYYDRYFWKKRSYFPSANCVGRLNSNSEFFFHFVKDPLQMKFNNERIMTPKDFSTRTRNSIKSKKRTEFVDEDGMVDNSRNPTYHKKLNSPTKKPTCFLEFPTCSDNLKEDVVSKFHPAPFSTKLPEFFIKWLTDENDLVCDPFTGSATVAYVAKCYNRNYWGFEINESYKDKIEERLRFSQLPL